MTWVERSTRCIVAHCVVMNRSEDAVGTLADDLRQMVWQRMPSARIYFNDAFSLYDTIGYPGAHQSLPNKRETYRRETLFASRGRQRRTAPLLGAVSPPKQVFFTPPGSTGAGGGFVCHGVEPAATLPLEISQVETEPDRFCHSSLVTPAFYMPIFREVWTRFASLSRVVSWTRRKRTFCQIYFTSRSYYRSCIKYVVSAGSMLGTAEEDPELIKTTNGRVRDRFDAE